MIDRIPDRDDLRDMGLAGSLGAGVVDVLAFGGETLGVIAFLMLDQIGVVLSLVLQLDRLTDYTDRIPEGIVEVVLVLVATIFVVVTAIRLGRRGIDRLTN